MQTHMTTSTKPPKPERTGRSPDKAKNIPFRVSDERRRHLKIECAIRGISMQKLLEMAVAEFLREPPEEQLPLL